MSASVIGHTFPPVCPVNSECHRSRCQHRFQGSVLLYLRWNLSKIIFCRLFISEGKNQVSQIFPGKNGQKSLKVDLVPEAMG